MSPMGTLVQLVALFGEGQGMLRRCGLTGGPLCITGGRTLRVPSHAPLPVLSLLSEVLEKGSAQFLLHLLPAVPPLPDLWNLKLRETLPSPGLLGHGAFS